MGGGAYGLDLVRPLGVDAIRIESRARRRKSTGRPCWRSLSPIFACAAASAPVCSASPARWRRRASSSASPRRLRPTSACAGLRKPPLPPALPAAPRSMVLMIGDFLSEPEDVARAIRAISAEGAIGELVMIVDPIEETYPFSGNTEFLHPAGSLQPAHAPGAELARRLSRAACRPSRSDPGDLRPLGLGHEHPSHRRIAGGDAAGAAHAPFRA